MILFCAMVIAAPVPPPAPLTEERLVGQWRYEYGDWLDGVMYLNKDGTYYAVHKPGCDYVYAGKWELRGNTVTLTQYRYCLDLGSQSGPATYAFEFNHKNYPVLVGKSNGWTHVAFKPIGTAKENAK